MNISTIYRARVFSKTLATITLATSALVLSGCSDDDPAPVVCTGSIVEIANCDDNFDTLYAAVVAAGLASNLDAEGLTVFAPTDRAFNDFFGALNLEASDFTQAQLADILSYHVLPSAVSAEDATNAAGDPSTNSPQTLLQNESVLLSLDSDNNLLVNRSQVTSADIQADNGVIHVIDKVLVPPNVLNLVQTAQVDGRFDTLVQAVGTAGLAQTLTDTSGATIFAPTDAAFEALIASNDALNTPADVLALPNLSDILTYHVVGSEVNSTAAVNASGTTVETLSNSEKVFVSFEDPNLYINTSRVLTDALLAVNVDASNGIIHAIDKVLLPPPAAVSDETKTIAGLVTDLAGASSGAEFTVLLAALSQENLDTTLTGAGPFTVFAPTDAAFAALLTELNVTQEQLLARDDLDGILLDHVLNGEVSATAAYEAVGTNVTSLRGNSLAVTTDKGGLVIDGSNVTTTDVNASNGVIHIIDKVIVKSAPGPAI